MAKQDKKVNYETLTVGYEFPPATFTLDAEMVSSYLEAVEESTGLYADGKPVPPMVVAARAMAALSEGFSLPPGAIHVSQELEFKKIAITGESFTSRSRVERKQDRGKFRMLTIGLSIFNEKQEAVVTGRTSFILPVS